MCWSTAAELLSDCRDRIEQFLQRAIWNPLVSTVTWWTEKNTTGYNWTESKSTSLYKAGQMYGWIKSVFSCVSYWFRTRQPQSQMFIVSSQTPVTLTSPALHCAACQDFVPLFLSVRYCRLSLPLYGFDYRGINKTVTLHTVGPSSALPAPLLALIELDEYFCFRVRAVGLNLLNESSNMIHSHKRPHLSTNQCSFCSFLLLSNAACLSAILSAVVDEHDEGSWRLPASVVQCWLLFCLRIWWNSSCYY